MTLKKYVKNICIHTLTNVFRNKVEWIAGGIAYCVCHTQCSCIGFFVSPITWYCTPATGARSRVRTIHMGDLLQSKKEREIHIVIIQNGNLEKYSTFSEAQFTFFTEKMIDYLKIKIK